MFIKNYASLMNGMQRTVSHITEISKFNAIALGRVGKVLDLGIKQDSRMSNEANSLIRVLINNGQFRKSSIIEFYVMGKIFTEGPKIFRPSVEQLAMLEQMTLNIQWKDYVQPFSTIIIELPENYCKSKAAILPQADLTFCGEKLPDKHEPTMMILHHNTEFKVILSALMFSTGFSIKQSFVMDDDEYAEDYITKIMGTMYSDSLECDHTEIQVTQDVIRSALNYCLLIDEIGAKKIGPGNPSYYQRLQKYREKEKDSQRQKKLTLEIKTHPILYELNQEVQLYKTVKDHSDLPSESTGKIMSPHHRRGHYRMQPHGPANSLRKRIRVPPVFVNSKLFLGAMSNAKAVYKEPRKATVDPLSPGTGLELKTCFHPKQMDFQEAPELKSPGACQSLDES